MPLLLRDSAGMPCMRGNRIVCKHIYEPSDLGAVQQVPKQSSIETVYSGSRRWMAAQAHNLSIISSAH